MVFWIVRSRTSNTTSLGRPEPPVSANRLTFQFAGRADLAGVLLQVGRGVQQARFRARGGPPSLGPAGLLGRLLRRLRVEQLPAGLAGGIAHRVGQQVA